MAYSNALNLLDDYDHGNLLTLPTSKGARSVNHQFCTIRNITIRRKYRSLIDKRHSRYFKYHPKSATIILEYILHCLELEVYSFNPRAKRVYEKAGFRYNPDGYLGR